MQSNKYAIRIRINHPINIILRPSIRAEPNMNSGTANRHPLVINDAEDYLRLGTL